MTGAQEAPVFFYNARESVYGFGMDQGFLASLIGFDHWLFQRINSQWSNAVFDFIFPFLTDLNRRPWAIPVVAVLLVVWLAKRRMSALVWILVLVVSVGATDLLCFRVIKASTNRARPEQAGLPVTLRTSRHSGSSFPSNHAANAFAAASVLSVAFPAAAPALFVVAALVAYSRVYVGVHFPFDVVCGAFIGWLIAFIIRLALRKLIIWGDLSEAHRHEGAERAEEKKRRKDLMRRK